MTVGIQRFLTRRRKSLLGRLWELWSRGCNFTTTRSPPGNRALAPHYNNGTVQTEPPTEPRTLSSVPHPRRHGRPFTKPQR
ncbi:hypothetical protein XELAEV_18017103mg [Xenopus laevis]|uniref:Uncharacterized protein n=1 Tax=Xenopus laevis TaxID=8355 RepID=A0A974HSP4_XENLA|nr:hypothetical protein XELAEV_18017103mg [Xenopus laevis]